MFHAWWQTEMNMNQRFTGNLSKCRCCHYHSAIILSNLCLLHNDRTKAKTTYLLPFLCPHHSVKPTKDLMSWIEFSINVMYCEKKKNLGKGFCIVLALVSLSARLFLSAIRSVTVSHQQACASTNPARTRLATWLCKRSNVGLREMRTVKEGIENMRHSLHSSLRLAKSTSCWRTGIEGKKRNGKH